MQIDPQVQEALEMGSGVVALESSVIAQGLPYPHNLNSALNCHEIIRDLGAVPATIAIIDGVIKVGLERKELEMLARGDNLKKAGLRDLPFLMANGLSGGTTVASTIYLARQAGIDVISTGGIGGVHKGGVDISADLYMLGEIDCILVAAGAKYFLDQGATLELLESLGVLTVGYGTDKWPAFYVNATRFPLPWQVDNPAEIASLYRYKKDLKIKQALLVCNPIPVQYALKEEDLQNWEIIARGGVKEAEVKGAEVTPRTLAALAEVSSGATVQANLILLENNARLAARIALAIGNF